MTSLRKLALGAFLTVSAFSAVTMTSCKKDDNGCQVGYEGSDCKTLSSAKFVKVWSATDKDATGDALPVYTSAIVNSSASDVTKVTISNFSNGLFDNSVVGSVNGNTLTVDVQQPDNDGYKVSGQATYGSDSKLTWTYTLTDPSGKTISYTGTWQ